jgi:translocation and assembly module TamB
MSVEAVAVHGALQGRLESRKFSAKFDARNTRVAEVEIAKTTLELGCKDGLLAGRIESRAANGTLRLAAKVVEKSEQIEIDATEGAVSWSGETASLTRPARLWIENSTLRTNGIEIAVDGGKVAVSGHADRKNLNIRAEIGDLPARLFDTIAPELGLAGKIGGHLVVSGPIERPRVAYGLAWKDATASAMRRAGLAPIGMSVTGGWVAGTLAAAGRINGQDNLNVTFDSRLKLNQNNALDIRANGDVPLSLFLAPLAERGTRGAGLVRVQLVASGAPSRPVLSGTLSLDGARLRDDATGVSLTGMRAAARLTGDAIEIDSIEAATKSGGHITGRGRIGIDPTRGFPGALSVEVTSLRFDDKEMMAGSLDADVTISGTLATAPVVKGNVRLNRVDVIIPEQLPRTMTELAIKHVGLTPEARKSLGLSEAKVQDGLTRTVLIDLTVLSPGQFFVRGRGVEAELNGEMRATGTSVVPVTAGQFRLRRGSLTLVGRRLALSRGTIDFAGQLEPVLDLEATSEADGIAITATLSGRASNPKLRLTSSPDLPEDEIFARLLFSKSLAHLSPVQMAQLAVEIDQLGGLTSGPSMVDQLRRSVGVDRLDVTTDKKGNTAVSAGSNITDQVYVGVQQNVSTNASRVIIDLDLTKHIKARGEAGSDGNGKLGIGVEWNY